MNSNQKGNLGLGRAIAHFTASGAIVSIPLTDSQPYDLIVDDGTLRKVQVRNTGHQNASGNYEVSLRVQMSRTSSGITWKKFTSSDWDDLFVYSPTGCYLIPSSAVRTGTIVTLSKGMNQYRLDALVI
jgi:hypothetical protein